MYFEGVCGGDSLSNRARGIRCQRRCLHHSYLVQSQKVITCLRELSNIPGVTSKSIGANGAESSNDERSYSLVCQCRWFGSHLITVGPRSRFIEGFSFIFA
ncbi:hypothetical protein J6590_081355 [Homalodisca vitripennis]|nr:hypothetical protein J6590_081355 [Homalodisca vitripennis]